MKDHKDLWQGKPYYSLDAYCKNTFGEKLYKVTLNANLGCPNRDGTLGRGGCIFCSQGGSGDFAEPLTSGIPSVTTSFRKGVKKLNGKRGALRYIGYFQAYTNTYGPVSYLEPLYKSALSLPEAAGISIATRPDCLGQDVMELLIRLKEEYPGKFIWIELGLQTIHEATARFIRRGYSLPCFIDALGKLEAAGIPVIVHTIFGLPGETQEMMLQTIAMLNTVPIFGVKLQLLHVLSHTELGDYYKRGSYTPLTFDEYLTLIISSLEILSPKITVHRLTGDAPRSLLLAPLWSEQKRTFLNTLHHTMKVNNSYQGKQYPHQEGGSGRYAGRFIDHI